MPSMPPPSSAPHGSNCLLSSSDIHIHMTGVIPPVGIVADFTLFDALDPGFSQGSQFGIIKKNGADISR